MQMFICNCRQIFTWNIRYYMKGIWNIYVLNILAILIKNFVQYFALHIRTFLTEAAIISFFLRDFPEDDRTDAETYRWHIVKWQMNVRFWLRSCWIKSCIISLSHGMWKIFLQMQSWYDISADMFVEQAQFRFKSLQTGKIYRMEIYFSFKFRLEFFKIRC